MKATSKKKTANYTASLKIFGKTFTATGASIPEAIDALKPGVAKGRAILTISKGDTTKERMLMPMATMRLFNTRGMAHDVVLKNTALMFAGI